jgi:hypothetical protein
MTQIAWKVRGRLEMLMKKNIYIYLFWNAKGRLEVYIYIYIYIYIMFSNRKQGDKYVQNILLAFVDCLLQEGWWIVIMRKPK